MRVIVVGNGGNELGDNSGTAIDAYDFVVRCNAAWLTLGPRFGHKTDALASKGFFKDFPDWCAEVGAQFWDDRLSQLVPHYGAELGKITQKKNAWLASRAFNAILMAIEKLTPGEVTVTACEALMSGSPRSRPGLPEPLHWNEKEKRWKVNKHYWAEERQLLETVSRDTNTEILWLPKP